MKAKKKSLFNEMIKDDKFKKKFEAQKNLFPQLNRSMPYEEVKQKYDKLRKDLGMDLSSSEDEEEIEDDGSDDTFEEELDEEEGATESSDSSASSEED
jgi:hypothetical protein